MSAADPTTSPDALPDFDKLWNYADPAATEARFREILPRAEATPDRAYLAELLTQIARTQGLQSRFADAHATLDRAENLLSPGANRPRVRCLLERGRLLNSGGQPDQALPLFQQASAVAEQAQERSLHIDTLHMLAIAERDPGRQIEWNLQAIQSVGDDPKLQRWLFALYNNLGEAYAAHGDHQNALQAFRSLADLDARSGREPDLYAQKDIARMLRKLERIDEAMAILHPLRQRLEKQNQRNGFVEEEWAECLLAKGQEAEAQSFFGRAYEAQKDDPWVVQHEPAKLERLRRLAGANCPGPERIGPG